MFCCVYSWAVCDGGWACDTNLTVWLPGDSEATGGWPFSHECWAHVACSSPLAVHSTALCLPRGEGTRAGTAEHLFCCTSLAELCSQRHALNYPKQTNAWCWLKIPDIWTCQKFCVSCGWGFRNVLRGYQNLLLSRICFWMCQHLFKINIERLVGIIRENFHK